MANTFNQIADLKAQLAKLEEQGRRELQERRAALVEELASIDAQLAGMDGEPAPAKRRGRKPGRPSKAAGRPAKAKKGSHKEFSDAAELKGVLTKAGGKLNRKGFTDAGYSLKSAKTIAKNDLKVFGVKESGAQGEVWVR